MEALQNFQQLPNDRGAIEALIQSLIDLLDKVDGDSDYETCNLEDDFVISPLFRTSLYAGCEISDPDYAVDDKGCDDSGYEEAEAHIIWGGLN